MVSDLILVNIVSGVGNIKFWCCGISLRADTSGWRSVRMNNAESARDDWFGCLVNASIKLLRRVGLIGPCNVHSNCTSSGRVSM